MCLAVAGQVTGPVCNTPEQRSRGVHNVLYTYHTSGSGDVVLVVFGLPVVGDALP
jgi:hypothetical protein